MQDNSNTISYSYDNAGVRVSKTVNGVDYKYVYLGNLLLFEQRGDMKFYYSYDANGTLYSVKYTTNAAGDNLLTYYFTHNSRGDIVGIYTGNGELRAKYEYDAWGNVISIKDQTGVAPASPTHIGYLNPFRYRDYYLDAETGLYYLMSRYYDPVTHRFLNADGYFQSGSDILDTNMYSYCANNPANNTDFDGQMYAKDGAEGAVFSKVKKNSNNVETSVNKTVKSFVKDTVNSAVQFIRNISDNLLTCTYTHGFSIVASFGLSIVFSVGPSVDTKGNFGLLLTAGIGAGTPGVSITEFKSIVPFQTIDGQDGWAVQAGGSGNILGTIATGGADVSFSGSGTGFSLGNGLGFVAPAEMHCLPTTSHVFGGNL